MQNNVVHVRGIEVWEGRVTSVDTDGGSISTQKGVMRAGGGHRNWPAPVEFSSMGKSRRLQRGRCCCMRGGYPRMGSCQGRMCGPAVAEIIAHVQGLPLEQMLPYTARPPLFPLALGELADMHMYDEA